MTSEGSSQALVASSARRLVTRLEYLLEKRLWAQILVALGAGIALGLALSPSGDAMVSESTANLIATWLALPGRLFLALVQMVVVPLVLSFIFLSFSKPFG